MALETGLLKQPFTSRIDYFTLTHILAENCISYDFIGRLKFLTKINYLCPFNKDRGSCRTPPDTLSGVRSGHETISNPDPSPNPDTKDFNKSLNSKVNLAG